MIDLEFHKQKEKKIVKLYNTIKIVTVLLVLLAVFFVRDILAKEKISAEKYLEQKRAANCFKPERKNIFFNK